MNNVLDYGLDRVTNPNEVKVNQVRLLHSEAGNVSTCLAVYVRQCCLSRETAVDTRVCGIRVMGRGKLRQGSWVESLAW